MNTEVEKFRSLFPRIHFDFNWDAFAAGQWPVTSCNVHEKDVLMRLTTAFRIRLGRVSPRFLKTIGSHYMSVEETLRHVHELDARRQDIIARYREQFEMSSQPLQLSFATYRIDHSRQLLLDGSHRACALAASGRPFVLTIYRIDGPRRFIPQ